MTALISLFTGDLLPYLIGGISIIAALIFGNVKGRAAAKAKQAEATVKGVVSGARGAAEATADLRKGKTPDHIVRANDGDWK